ncbi:MAG: beta-ketoacyl synthase chain length factor [Georgfuchsia sp.]
MSSRPAKDIGIEAWIDGVGLLAPGFIDWPQGMQVLAGHAPYIAAPTLLPAPAVLPPAERRRASRMVKLALGVGLEAVNSAGADAAILITVFSSSSGDGQNCHVLCECLAAEDHQVSPTRFTNSVHNTAAGYWGIATGATPASQVICAYDASFAAGLLEALAQVRCERVPVLLIAYDAEYAGPLHDKRPLPDAGGIALLLSPAQSARSIASIEIELNEAPLTTLADPTLEALRCAIPALRGLPLLQVLAARQSGCVSLEYLAPLQLQATLNPC